jgi:vacuolar-type H+-ATPase subunit E/Vma4
MALEDIFRALQEQADRDVEAVLEEAHAHAKVIHEQAEREAEEVRATRIAEAERAVIARSSQDMNSARLEARKHVAAVKERAIRDVFDDALAGLADVRGRSDYPAVFAALADEAMADVSGEFELLVDPSDVELARQYLAERGKTAEIRPDISTAGGIIIVTEGGTVLRRNTLEDRLDKLRGLAQADVAEIIFE